MVLIAMYFMILGPYAGARAVILALGADPSRVQTWGDRIDYFDQSIRASPELANYPRRFMFASLSSNWSKLSEEEIEATLEAAEREGRKALEAEPREWRIHLALANLYQTAASLDPSYGVQARDLLDEALALAPERIELRQLEVRQFAIEKDYEGALNAIDSYLKAHTEYLLPDSKMTRIFESLRNEVTQAAKAANED